MSARLTVKEVRRLVFYEDGTAIIYRDLWASEKKLIADGLLVMQRPVGVGQDIRLTPAGRAALASSARKGG